MVDHSRQLVSFMANWHQDTLFTSAEPVEQSVTICSRCRLCECITTSGQVYLP